MCAECFVTLNEKENLKRDETIKLHAVVQGMIASIKMILLLSCSV